MPASNIFTPEGYDVTTTLTEFFDVPPGFDYMVNVRVANMTTSSVLYRLAIGPAGSTPPTGLTYRVYDKAIPPGEAYDFEELLDLPAGWALFQRASTASALQVSVTGRKKATT